MFGIEEKSRLVEYLGLLGAGGISIYLAWVGKRRADAMHKTAHASRRPSQRASCQVHASASVGDCAITEVSRG